MESCLRPNIYVFLKHEENEIYEQETGGGNAVTGLPTHPSPALPSREHGNIVTRLVRSSILLILISRSIMSTICKSFY